MPSDIKAYHWKAIIESIATDSCVPFLGAGVNAGNDKHTGLPLANEVALRMASSITDLNDKELKTLIDNADKDTKILIANAFAKKNVQEGDIEEYLTEAEPLPSLIRATLPDLAQVALQVEVYRDRLTLMREIHKILSNAKVKPSPILNTLASMRKATSPKNVKSSPFKLIVTTNYDNLLEQAFGKKPFELVIQSATGIKDIKQIQRRLSKPRGPIIYKIHGSFNSNGNNVNLEDKDRLVLTEEDYIDFLSNMGHKDTGVPPLIKAKMVQRTILFLGYGLQDWDFRTIYKTMIEPIGKQERPQSYAIQKNPPAYLRDYWREKKVTILKADLHEFAAELQDRWKRSNHT